MNAAATILLVALATSPLLRAAEAPPVAVTLRVSPAEPTLADRIILTLTATVPRAPLERVLRTGRDGLYAVEPPTDALRALDAWRFLDLTTEDSVLDGSRSQRVLRYEFEPRRAGPVEVPSLTVVFWPDAPDRKPAVVTTEPLAFRVQGAVEGDPLDAEPRPALPDPGPQGSGTVPAVLLVAVLLTLAALAWRHVRRRRGTAAPPLPAEREAVLRALEGSADPRAWLAALDRFGDGIAPEIRSRWRADLEAAAFGPGGRSVGAEVLARIREALRAEPGTEKEETP